MEFDRSLISSLPKSLDFFVRSLVLSCNTLWKGKLISDKPEFILQTEEFSDFFKNVLSDPKLVDKFREKVLKDIYDQNYTDIIEKIVGDDGKAQDKFMSSDIRFNFNKFCLPVSAVYKAIVEFSKKQRVVHPAKILLGFYAVMFHTVVKEESKESLDLISVNINQMIDTLEEMARPPPREKSNFFQEALKNFNPGQATELLNKISNMPEANGQAKDALAKVKEMLSSDNPLEGLGNLLEETKKMASQMGEVPPDLEETAAAVAATEPPVEEETSAAPEDQN